MDKSYLSEGDGHSLRQQHELQVTAEVYDMTDGSEFPRSPQTGIARGLDYTKDRTSPAATSGSKQLLSMDPTGASSQLLGSAGMAGTGELSERTLDYGKSFKLKFDEPNLEHEEDDVI